MQRVWRGMEDMSVSDHSLVWNSDLMEALELAPASRTRCFGDGRIVMVREELEWRLTGKFLPHEDQRNLWR